MTSNPNALAIAPSLDNALANIEEKQLTRLAALAKRSVVVGSGNSRRAVTDNEAGALALISLATGASFANGELYLTDTGPMFGVPLYERKADEYMWALLPGSSYHIAYRDAAAGVDAIFNPDKGDVAQVAILTRDDWDTTWKKNYTDYFLLLVNAGAPWEKANEYALKMSGPKPSLEFVGVVAGSESFSGDEWVDGKKTGGKKPEMFDRVERAKKRARKGALKHAFPRLSIPEPVDIMAKPTAAKLIEVATRNVAQEPAPSLAPRIISDPDGAEQEIMASLGYVAPQKSSPAPVIIDAYPAPVDMAFSEVDGRGKFLKDYSTVKLTEFVQKVQDKLTTEKDPEEITKLQFKRDAASTIIMWRANHPEAYDG